MNRLKGRNVGATRWVAQKGRGSASPLQKPGRHAGLPLQIVCVLIFLASGASVGGAADYLGAQGCIPCHASIHTAWQKTRHARAMEDLVLEQKQDNVTCVPCHSTGYGEPMGFLDMTATPELASVQCEACHGPAKTHAAEPEKVKTVLRKPGPKTCRRCHTAEQDSVFDYENMSKKVH